MALEQELDRSVLERKEREELRAIAKALSVETTSRTKKADIIDQILAAVASGGAGAGSGNGSLRGHDPVATDGANGKAAAKVAKSTAGADRAARSEPPSWDGTDGVVGLDTGTAGSDELASAASGEASNEAGEAAGAPAASREPGAAGLLSAGQASADSATADSATADSATADAATAVPATAEGAGTERAGTERAGTERAGTERAGTERAGTERGTGQALEATRREHAQPSPALQPSRQGGAEQSGRRNRRRRGRDRERSGDRELQGANQEAAYQGELVEVSGILDQRDEGFGFLRAEGYLPGPKDVYVSVSQVRRFALRKGDFVEGACRPAASNEKYPALIRIDKVSGLSPEEARNRPRFEDLTPLFPDEKLRLEIPGASDNVTARIIDLLAPIGKGQRGLIVSPPKAGKTTIMKQIAHSIEANNPEVHLIVLLVDERPEEVTDMRRSVKGEVVASTFDRPADEHTQVSELVIERAKRLVEMGRDVVIILDGITRLARAYNLAQPASGRIMSGGVDSGALYPPKKFFGAARNIEEGGSLTILATALVETGSKMDEVIFEEFKGTGNMELRLDRRLAERRLYPSIDVNASSTRHEELLFERNQLQQVWKLRRVLNALAADGNAAPGLELLMDKIRQTKSNDEFLAEIAKGPAPPV